MPERPELMLVRKFHHLVSPFVGQWVNKKLQPISLQCLWLQDTQVLGPALWWWWLPGILKLLDILELFPSDHIHL
uniref:Uncharacterized protein n=1 Tax=Cebus imitator TaxID=2715852 RepID=A0A2K5SG89_CEBIM